MSPTAVYHKGKPFTPPVIHGVVFNPDPDQPGIWLGEVPDAVLPQFHLNVPGTAFWIAAATGSTAPPASVTAPHLSPEDLMTEACLQKSKAALAAWAQKTLAFTLNPEAGTRDWMLGAIADHLNPGGVQDPTDLQAETLPEAPAADASIGTATALEAANAAMAASGNALAAASNADRSAAADLASNPTDPALLAAKANTAAALASAVANDNAAGAALAAAAAAHAAAVAQTPAAS